MKLSELFFNRRITARVIQRFKASALVFSIFMIFMVAKSLAQYTFQGDSYSHYKLYTSSKGYIEVYSNKDKVCSSYLQVEGTELVAYWLLGIVYMFFQLYLFLGITIAVDICLEAVEVITSKTMKSKVKNSKGIESEVDVSIWNPTIANVTIMALASGSPEILLTVIETFETYGISTGELGPSFIVGSSAFNLLIVVGISTVLVPIGVVKKINNFSVWTEGKITIPEAVLTFCFYFLFVIFAYVVDKISSCISNRRGPSLESLPNGLPEYASKHFNIEEFNELVKECKHDTKSDSIQEEAKQKSGELVEEEKKSDQALEPDEIKKISDENHQKTKRLEVYLKQTFKVDDITDIDPDYVRKALEPTSVIERLKYRQEVANRLATRRPFVVVKGTGKKQTEYTQSKNLKKEDLNPYIGFKCLHYSVIEGAGSVEITIIKKTKDALEIGLRTVDDTAIAPDDYHHKDETLLL